MNKKFISLFAFIILICQLTIIPSAIAAKNIDDLVSQGKLTINLQVNQKEQHIVGQALVLSIEVSTDRWFSTGSQVQYFTLKDVVMQANNTTTINGSKRINGQTWAMQTHEITLYPAVSGTYQIPAIKVDVSVNTENDGIINGVLKTNKSSFNIELPKALEGIENFIVSPLVTLNIDGQFDEKADYAVGEAITQTITITALDIPAMMITPINFIKDKKATLAGLSIYHKPAQAFDKSTRGSLLGTRVESFTYIFEKPGDYVIEEKIIYWWNSQSSTLKRLLIPSFAWTVSGGSQVSSSAHFKALNITTEAVTSLVIVILLLLSVYIGFVKRHDLSALYNKLTKREQRKLRSNFLNAITEQNYLVATQYLYQYGLLSYTAEHQKVCPLSDKLNQLAFNDNNADKVQHSFSINEAKQLLNRIDTHMAKKEKAANFSPNERININSE